MWQPKCMCYYGVYSVNLGEWYCINSVACDTLWKLDSLFSYLYWCGPLRLAFPNNVAYACINIQQVPEEEEEGDTPHIDTWRNARVSDDFFVGLHWWQNSWYKREKCNNKEWDLNYEYPFTRVQDIGEWVILWGLILRSLGCVMKATLVIQLFNSTELEDPHADPIALAPCWCIMIKPTTGLWFDPTISDAAWS